MRLEQTRVCTIVDRGFYKADERVNMRGANSILFCYVELLMIAANCKYMCVQS